MRVAHFWLSLALFGALVASGCSGGPKLIPVKGQVTMGGKPLPNVQVDFHPDPDKGVAGPSSTGTTNDNGEFTLVMSGGDKQPGAVAGHHRVIVTDLAVFGTKFVGRGDYRSEDPKGPKEVPTTARFPATYGDLSKTPLKQEVKAGMGAVTLEVKK